MLPKWPYSKETLPLSRMRLFQLTRHKNQNYKSGQKGIKTFRLKNPSTLAFTTYFLTIIFLLWTLLSCSYLFPLTTRLEEICRNPALLLRLQGMLLFARKDVHKKGSRKEYQEVLERQAKCRLPVPCRPIWVLIILILSLSVKTTCNLSSYDLSIFCWLLDKSAETKFSNHILASE